MKTQLQTQNSKEVTVNTSTGEAYISQRKAAEKLGVALSSLQHFCRSLNSDVKQGLSSEIFSLSVTHYALDSKAATQEAKELLRMISQAGAKAYLYHEAGYVLNTAPRTPKSQIELARESVAQAQAMLALIETQTELQIETDRGEEYFSTKRIKELNNGVRIGGGKLARYATKLGIPAKPMFAHYPINAPTAWHISVWLAAYPNLNYPN